MNKIRKFSKRSQKKHLYSQKTCLNLKNKKKIQNGGGPEMDKLLLPKVYQRPSFTQILDIIIKNKKEHSPIFNNGSKNFINKLFNEFLTDDLYNELITLDKNNLEIYKTSNQTLFDKFSEQHEYISQFIEYTENQKKLLEILFDLTIKKYICYNEIIMNQDDFDIYNCKNSIDYEGNCSQPYFRDSIYEKSDIIENDNIINVLNKIRTKLDKGKSIGLILGANKIEEYYDDYDINLYFNKEGQIPRSSFSSIINEIENEPLKKRYYIDSYFPLNIKPDNIRVLDLILELTNDYHITLVNKICIGCYRSFYYLKKNAKQNFKYQVSFVDIYGTHNSYNIKQCFINPSDTDI